VLEPERIPFISYPYEWSFGQLRDAALLVLDIEVAALERGLTLRDGTAYNVQFRDARPLLIDTLSFGPHTEGRPWTAYGQFCEHFLAPLALMSLSDVRGAALLRHYLDGIPLDLASGLLPRRSWLRPGLTMHLHLHARAQRRYAEADVARETGGRSLTRTALIQLLQHLRGTIAALAWTPAGTEWADYVDHTNYSSRAHDAKAAIVRGFLATVRPGVTWDLGANTGTFSRLARESCPQVVAFDLDPAAVERHYRQLRASETTGILPLVQDLRNPSSDLGWAHRERMSLARRGPADLVLALALIHHLAISNNTPLDQVAEYLAQLGRHLIIEFVPKQDSQVRRLLTNRPDIFPDYTPAGFEQSFRRHFEVLEVAPVEDSERSLYLMRSRIR
jgi:hypothetical protein